MRYCQTPPCALGVQPFGRTMPFITKDQAIPVGVLNIPIQLVGFGGEQPQSLGRIGTLLESRPVSMMMHIQGMPVIHTAAPEVLVGDRLFELLGYPE